MAQNLPPLPSEDAPAHPNSRRPMNNFPSRMTHNNEGKRMGFEDQDTNPEDAQRKRGRIWGFSAKIIVSDAASITPTIPLDVDNGLPGIELWFGTHVDNKVGFIYHMDTCAAMNTVNLLVHKWFMTQHPHLVAEYIQFDDSYPFELLQLHCAVADLNQTEYMHSKLTAIVRYRLHYEKNGKRVLLSFGLGDSVTVNSIVGIPTIQAWNIFLILM